jgi:general secretion pathway protein J
VTSPTDIVNAHKRCASRGFTLPEVLIAVSLLALLSLMVVSGLHFGVRAWRKSSVVVSSVEEISFAQQFLRRSLTGAYPHLVGKGVQSVDFKGSATELSFLGPVPQSVSPAARAHLIFHTEPSAGGMSLIVEIRPELMRSDARNAIITETLIDDMENIKFSYRAEGESDWRDQWMNKPHLPALIRIESEPREGDRRIWPTLIVSPGIDVDVSCRYDPLTKYCQGRR